jgi:hypothetical protein
MAPPRPLVSARDASGIAGRNLPGQDGFRRPAGGGLLSKAAFFQSNKVFANGRLLKWPPFAKGSLSGLGTGFAALLAYEDAYRALEGDATIPVNRPIRPEFERGGRVS